MPVHSRPASFQAICSPGPKRKTHCQLQLPVEILEFIVQEILALNRSREFACVRDFCRASRLFRQIALRLYFSKVKLGSIAKAGWIFCIPGSTGWVRQLSTTINILTSRILPLHKFQLASLEIDCLLENQRSVVPQTALLAPLLPSSLTALKIDALPHICKQMLQSIAGSCAELEELELSVVGRLDTGCCWDCFDESGSCIVHSPVGDLHFSAEELAASYARLLRPLSRLRRLSLGVFLSGEEVLVNHINAHSEMRQTYNMISSPSADASSAPHSPESGGTPADAKLTTYNIIAASFTGGSVSTSCSVYTPADCLRCFGDHGTRVRKEELAASIKVAQILRSLESVRWSSWFSVSGGADEGSDLNVDRMISDEDPDDKYWTEIWIMRKDERIRVKREPWEMA